MDRRRFILAGLGATALLAVPRSLFALVDTAPARNDTRRDSHLTLHGSARTGCARQPDGIIPPAPINLYS